MAMIDPYAYLKEPCRNCKRNNLEVFACDSIKGECLACCGCEDHDYTYEETEESEM
jgi:hypothetical protein